MIVLTSPVTVQNEFGIIHQMLQEGLSSLHIRKPDYSETEMRLFLDQMVPEFRSKLVLHQHHQLAEEFGISKAYFPATTPDRFLKPVRCTGTHSIEAFNALPDYFDYAFLSPVFKSISKPGYQSQKNLLETLKNRTNFKVKLIALGGITSDNIPIALESGFDGVALLGTIWNSDSPIKNFRKCLYRFNSVTTL